MAKFLKTKGTTAGVENIIINAEKELVIISPYLDISKMYLTRLKNAVSKKVSVKIVCRKDKIKSEIIKQLLDIGNIELKHLDNLHAKCYFNEKEMIITSFNLYEYSEKNWEMGISLERSVDKELFEEGYKEAVAIFNESKADYEIKHNFKTSVIPTKFNVPPTNFKHPTFGTCIRCKNKISFNPDKPYCLSCYSSWENYRNPSYGETTCHSCGKFEWTTINKPFCYTCVKQYGHLLSFNKTL